MQTLLGSRYRAFKFWKTKQNLWPLCPHPNTLLTFKGDEFINQLYKFSTQSSMQGYNMGLIDCFYPDYSENHKQTAEWTYFKQFGCKIRVEIKGPGKLSQLKTFTPLCFSGPGRKDIQRVSEGFPTDSTSWNV